MSRTTEFEFFFLRGFLKEMVAGNGIYSRGHSLRSRTPRQRGQFRDALQVAKPQQRTRGRLSRARTRPMTTTLMTSHASSVLETGPSPSHLSVSPAIVASTRVIYKTLGYGFTLRSRTYHTKTMASPEVIIREVTPGIVTFSKCVIQILSPEY